MKLTIHRGTHEIGGSCVELQAGTASILIDFGLPLAEKYSGRIARNKSNERSLKDDLPPTLKGIYDRAGFDAVLISHAHQDHYGLLSLVHPNIPVYLSKGTKELIELGFLFNQTNCQLNNIKIVEAWRSFQIKDVKITPYLVDHSGFDAMAFLIEAEGKRLFYSGDFRGHGRKGKLFQAIIERPIRNIDYLIMEGTMLSRADEPYGKEEDVEREMASLLKSNGNLTFLSCSSQNIDRIVSAYRACVKTGTTFVIDPYTAYILYKLKDIAKGVPQYNWGETMRVFFIPHKYTDKVLKEKKFFELGKARISKEEVFSLKHKMLVKDSFMMRNIFQNKRLLSGTKVIFSQWVGYLDDQKDFWEKNNVEIVKLHTSGHAYLEDLVDFAKALKPNHIIPIHTEKPDKYTQHFGSNVIMLNDGETIVL